MLSCACPNPGQPISCVNPVLEIAGIERQEVNATSTT